MLFCGQQASQSVRLSIRTLAVNVDVFMCVCVISLSLSVDNISVTSQQMSCNKCEKAVTFRVSICN